MSPRPSAPAPRRSAPTPLAQLKEEASLIETLTTVEKTPAPPGFAEAASPVESAETSVRRVAEIVVDTLEELGVTTYYGIPGGALASVYDAFCDRPQLRVINTRHETGAVFMAMGHSRIGRTLPVVLVTSGPGITNAMTGLAAAHADGIPLVLIAGEVPKKNFGRGALQEGSRYQMDVLGMARSVTKWCAEITNAGSADSMVRKAVAIARSGRQGPVLLTLPLDVASTLVARTDASTQVTTTFTVDDRLIARAASALQNSENGLILVGSGARSPEAARLVGTLASTLNIPVATTPKAKGLFPENDPLSLGVFGHGGHPSANDYVAEGVDVILCVGCGLGEAGTNSWTTALQANTTFIQVDIDAGQLGKNYRVDVGLVGPADMVLMALVGAVTRRTTPAFGSGIRHWRPEDRTSNNSPLQPARILTEVQRAFGPDAIFTSDIGEHMMFALHYLTIDRPDSFLVNSGFGSMGSGIGTAIGAKVAAPHRPVVCVCGDFGFQMYGSELATCVQESIGVVFVVFNDARMRMVESGLSQIYGRSKTMSAPRVDFAAMARSVGARGVSVRTIEELEALRLENRNSTVPLVVDVEVDPNAKFPASSRVAELNRTSGVIRHGHALRN